MIESPANARVAAARALGTRKGRRSAGRYLVEGPHAVGELLGEHGRHQTVELFVTADAAVRERLLVDTARSAGADVHVVTDRVLARLDDTVTSQGVVAVARRTALSVVDVLALSPTLVVVLAGVADPGNAGTVIRTAAAAGADAVIVTQESADVFSAKAIRASAGSLFHVPVVTGAGVRDIHALSTAGMQLLATAADGEKTIDELADAGALSRPTAWLMGNEAHGLSAQFAGLTTASVRIPMHPRAESLNLAAAAAVCLFMTTSARRRSAARK